MYGAGGQKRVSDNFVANYYFALPSPLEREKIAVFLEHQTAKIDTLIAKQRRLIELLQEKRQAVISHAVTKGLNPDVPMKNSGVEWLGEVPEHWIVSKIKFQLVNIEGGWSSQCENRSAENGEYGVMKVGCVNGGVFNPEENKALPAELEPKREYALKENDLLISRANTRELVGSAAVVPKDFPHLLLCDKLYRLRFSKTLNPYFVSYYLGSELIREQIEFDATGASQSMQNISQDVIKELPLLLPPKNEMQRILTQLENYQIKLTETLNKAEQSISLLQERRTALVSATVTGKIDARGWEQPAPPLVEVG